MSQQESNPPPAEGGGGPTNRERRSAYRRAMMEEALGAGDEAAMRRLVRCMIEELPARNFERVARKVYNEYVRAK